jgi:hypothetical protein
LVAYDHPEHSSEFGAVADAQLRVSAAKVVVDGSHGQAEAIRELGLAGRSQPDDIPLLPGQRGVQRFGQQPGGPFAVTGQRAGAGQRGQGRP